MTTAKNSWWHRCMHSKVKTAHVPYKLIGILSMLAQFGRRKRWIMQFNMKRRGLPAYWDNVCVLDFAEAMTRPWFENPRKKHLPTLLSLSLISFFFFCPFSSSNYYGSPKSTHKREDCQRLRGRCLSGRAPQKYWLPAIFIDVYCVFYSLLQATEAVNVLRAYIHPDGNKLLDNKNVLYSPSSWSLYS